MSKASKAAKKLARAGTTPPTNGTAPADAPTPAPDTKAAKKASATLIKLQGEYKKSPNAVLRKVNKVYAQQLLEKKLTWVEYCDLKIKAFTDHWTAKKTNPAANKLLKPLTQEAAEKKRASVEKLKIRLAAEIAALAEGVIEETPVMAAETPDEEEEEAE